MKKIIYLTIVFTLILSTECWSQNVSDSVSNYLYEEIKDFPEPLSWVNDYESVFNKAQKKKLEAICRDFERKTTNQIFIVTIADIEPYDNLKDFTTDLGNYWGVGTAEKDNGLIISYSGKRREVWIGTGRGTEEILTTEILQLIIDNFMLEEFKKGNTFAGILAGLNEVIDKWEHE